jgi:hypothetical protein
LSTFQRDIDCFLKSVDIIYIFVCIGGEPLLIRDLDAMLLYINKIPQIKHIYITTNATILPDNKLIDAMLQVKRAQFVISNYSMNNELKGLYKADQFIDICKQNNIRYYTETSDNFIWGKSEKIQAVYEKDSSQAHSNFNICPLRRCQTLCNGKFYCCPPALYVDRHYKDFKFERDECFGIINKQPEMLTQDMINFFSKDYFELCSICDLSNITMPVIPAVQIPKNTITEGTLI